MSVHTLANLIIFLAPEVAQLPQVRKAGPPDNTDLLACCHLAEISLQAMVLMCPIAQCCPSMILTGGSNFPRESNGLYTCGSKVIPAILDTARFNGRPSCNGDRAGRHTHRRGKQLSFLKVFDLVWPHLVVAGAHLVSNAAAQGLQQSCRAFNSQFKEMTCRQDSGWAPWACLTCGVHLRQQAALLDG